MPEVRGAHLVMIALIASSAGCVTGRAAGRQETLQILSDTYTIDRKYKSMVGPWSRHTVTLLNEPVPELVWITGYETEMVAADNQTPMPPELMCHSNLDVNFWGHKAAFAQHASITEDRMFTLSQGERAIRLPPGFGIPALSNEPLSLTAQVLNLNYEGAPFQVKHKITIHLVRDRDLRVPMKPLFMVGAAGMVAIGASGQTHDPAQAHAPSCVPGMKAPHSDAASVYRDRYGRVLSGHWIVEPGRHEYRNSLKPFMVIPFDTTIHFIAVHLHPFAESIELRDLTTGTTVFKSKARNFRDRIGLKSVDYFSSQRGLPIFKDHEYELVSIYNNTTAVDQDSMAALFLYLRDREFQKPQAGQLTTGEPTAQQPAAGAQQEL